MRVHLPETQECPFLTWHNCLCTDIKILKGAKDHILMPSWSLTEGKECLQAQMQVVGVHFLWLDEQRKTWRERQPGPKRVLCIDWREERAECGHTTFKKSGDPSVQGPVNALRLE